MRDRRHVGAALAALLLLVAGCGGLETQSPEEILAAAQAAARGAAGYQVSGAGSFGNGVTQVDFRVRGGDVAGSLVASGATVLVTIAAGDVYFQAPPSFYEAGGLSASAASHLGNRWVEVPVGSAMARPFSGLLALTTLASELQHHGPLRSEGLGTADGRRVVRIRDTRSGSILAVRTEGPAYPVRLEEVSGSDGGTLRFFHWGAVAAITPPPNPLLVGGG